MKNARKYPAETKENKNTENVHVDCVHGNYSCTHQTHGVHCSRLLLFSRRFSFICICTLDKYVPHSSSPSLLLSFAELDCIFLQMTIYEIDVIPYELWPIRCTQPHMRSVYDAMHSKQADIFIGCVYLCFHSTRTHEFIFVIFCCGCLDAQAHHFYLFLIEVSV